MRSFCLFLLNATICECSCVLPISLLCVHIFFFICSMIFYFYSLSFDKYILHFMQYAAGTGRYSFSKCFSFHFRLQAKPKRRSKIRWSMYVYVIILMNCSSHNHMKFCKRKKYSFLVSSTAFITFFIYIFYNEASNISPTHWFW